MDDLLVIYLSIVVQTFLFKIFHVLTQLIEIEILGRFLFRQPLELLLALGGRRVARVHVAGHLHPSRRQIDLEEDEK